MTMDEWSALGVAVSEDIAAGFDEVVQTRRDLHRHPELGFAEKRTQGIVLKQLAAMGIDAEPCADTGVIGLIRGKRPGRVLMLRADMDALPIDEAGDAPWKSETPGVMHACGHDAHTAMLLGVAKVLRQRGIETGTVKLMFQPAEEGDGGALAMIKDGLLDNPRVDAALGFHVWSGYPVGQVMARPGPVAASVDGFKLTVRGKGTHGATPEDGVDPVVIAAQIVTAAQALVTRRVGSRHRAVLSFTSVHGGSAFNIIPETVEMLGTFRTFDNGVRERIRRDLEHLAGALAASMGGSAEYTSLTENMPVLNDPGMTEWVRRSAEAVVGADRIISPEPLMVGEDFGEVSERVPSAFVWLGAGHDDPALRFPHHHPRFTIDERVLAVGVAIAVRSVYDFLEDKR